MSTIIPPNPSPQLQAALHWLDGFNNWNVDQILSGVTDDYIHRVLPQSIGRPPRTKEDFREYFTSVQSMFNGMKFTIHDIIEGQNRIFLHVTSDSISTTGFPYKNEYNITMRFITQADGTVRLSEVKEFLDSKYAMEFFTGERERQAAKKI